MINHHKLKVIFFFLVLWQIFSFSSVVAVHAATPPSQAPIIIPCGCPVGKDEQEDAVIQEIYQKRGDQCVDSYEEFKKDPIRNHFWIEDKEITTQGKADERARQFIFWILNKKTVNNYPVLKDLWKTSKNIAFFFLVLVVAAMGIGMIVSKKSSFVGSVFSQSGFKAKSSLVKILLLVLYIFFSAAIVITLVQLSEIIMRFFVEAKGGKDLFNIYFSSISKEQNYINFKGCRDLNWQVQEAARSEIFLLKLTNVTYYIMGTMLLLRTILLWFLLIISPFLAILLPFKLIRNVGFIWIGVFFQWLFYGPLFAIFLSATALIWRAGIPFIFDFQRANTVSGYVYPTAISILYGGPAQKLQLLNNGNYVDTFVEYVITLIMLWAVIFFPWWLLRIFRDYCCGEMRTAKNILHLIYNRMGGGRFGSPPTQPAPGASFNLGKMSQLGSQRREISSIEKKIFSSEEIKKVSTEDISRVLKVHVSKLTDIANLETNRQVNQVVQKNLQGLKDPVKISNVNERKKFVNIKNEIFNRAIKQDQRAQKIVTAVSSSKLEKIRSRERFIKAAPALAPVVQIVSSRTKTPVAQVTSISNSFFNSLSQNQSIVNQIATQTGVEQQKVRTVLANIPQNVGTHSIDTINKISEKTQVAKESVSRVINYVQDVVKKGKEKTATDTVNKVSQSLNLDKKTVQKILDTQLQIMAAPEDNVDQAIKVPPTIPLEEYEEVKKMWEKQYSQGEVPVSDTIKTRADWYTSDIVFITNTLNKLLSNDPKLKNEALDSLGYIIPIFLINNLSQEKLLVYLKAKLEAAKTVKERLFREEEIKNKLKAKLTKEDEEELVDVPIAAKKAEEKTLTLQKEREIPKKENDSSPPTDKP